MAIQWFPGHMNATKKAIQERIKLIDAVIELLDARLPGSSRSPLLAELIAGKPSLKVLNKQDLADPGRTAQWLSYYNAQPGTQAIGLDASTVAPVKALMKACYELVPNRGTPHKPLRVLICGVPNVGKSTLMNSIAGKRAAKTGDEAGITKHEQRYDLASDFYLFDTPGMLWPKIIVEKSGYNLAASGAIGRNAFEDDDVALDLLSYLKVNYPALLSHRYDLLESNVAELDDLILLEAIAKRRGALLAGKRVDYQKAAELLIHDFRSGILGRITLETPSEYNLWTVQGMEKEAAFQLSREEKIAKRKERGA